MPFEARGPVIMPHRVVIVRTSLQQTHLNSIYNYNKKQQHNGKYTITTMVTKTGLD